MTATSRGSGHRVRLVGLAAAFAGIGLLVTACGGSTGYAGPGSSGSGSGSGPVTIETHSGPMGSYLTDGSGKTVYLFAKDKGHTSTCSGSCATYWPPVTTNGSPKGAGQVHSGELATSKRSDGSSQVTYNGHPLYYYIQDKSAGDTKGQGLNLSGGLWWLVSPSGSALTKTGPMAQHTPSKAGSTSSGGSGGWG